MNFLESSTWKQLYLTRNVEIQLNFSNPMQLRIYLYICSQHSVFTFGSCHIWKLQHLEVARGRNSHSEVHWDVHQHPICCKISLRRKMFFVLEKFFLSKHVFFIIFPTLLLLKFSTILYVVTKLIYCASYSHSNNVIFIRR